MFKLEPITHITRTIEFTPPGAGEPSSFDVDFKYLGKKARLELHKELQKYNQAADLARREFEARLRKADADKISAVEYIEPDEKLTDIDVANRLTLDIRGLQSVDGEELGYTPELLDQLLDMDYVSGPYFEAMYEQVYGEEVAQMMRKN